MKQTSDDVTLSSVIITQNNLTGCFSNQYVSSNPEQEDCDIREQKSQNISNIFMVESVNDDVSDYYENLMQTFYGKEIPLEADISCYAFYPRACVWKAKL